MRLEQNRIHHEILKKEKARDTLKRAFSINLSAAAIQP